MDKNSKIITGVIVMSGAFAIWYFLIRKKDVVKYHNLPLLTQPQNTVKTEKIEFSKYNELKEGDRSEMFAKIRMQINKLLKKNVFETNENYANRDVADKYFIEQLKELCPSLDVNFLKDVLIILQNIESENAVLENNSFKYKFNKVFKLGEKSTDINTLKNAINTLFNVADIQDVKYAPLRIDGNFDKRMINVLNRIFKGVSAYRNNSVDVEFIEKFSNFTKQIQSLQTL